MNAKDRILKSALDDLVGEAARQVRQSKSRWAVDAAMDTQHNRQRRNETHRLHLDLIRAVRILMWALLLLVIVVMTAAGLMAIRLSLFAHVSFGVDSEQGFVSFVAGGGLLLATGPVRRKVRAYRDFRSRGVERLSIAHDPHAPELKPDLAKKSS